MTTYTGYLMCSSTGTTIAKYIGILSYNVEGGSVYIAGTDFKIYICLKPGSQFELREDIDQEE